MITKHSNFDYSGNIPEYTGDRRYSQDILRDFWSQISAIGSSLKGITGEDNYILKGGNVSQGASVSLIDITETFLTVKTSVEIPDSWTALPPTKISKDIIVPLYLSSVSDQSLSSATLDGATTNYVKLSYSKTYLSSRTRAKKTGSYYSEVQPIASISINSTAPTSYEIAIATFVGDGSTFLNITNLFDERSIIKKENDILDLTEILINRSISKWSTTTITDNDFNDVTYSESLGLFVAVGFLGANNVAYSSDGMSWTIISIPNGSLAGIVFSESLGLFVAVGFASANNVAYSSDGINWTSITIADGFLHGVTYSESLGLFVAVGVNSTNNVAYSSDGINWTSITIADGDLNGVTYSESLGRFVAVGSGSSNNVAYSSDGINWTSITIANGGFQVVTFSESLGRFVTVGINNTNNVAYS